MAVKYGKFELPEKIRVGDSDKRNHFTRFVAEPFERGFGHTVGNALRRIMLASLEAPACISVTIEGVLHEYMPIEGIVEDMTHIILNLKGALLRKLPSDEDPRSRETKVISKMLDVTSEQIEAGGGQYVVRFKDLIGPSDFEVVNPEHPIFTCTKPMSRKVQLRVAMGRGYVPSERHQIAEQMVDEIVIDSAFSPVTMVNYYVENTRVGQDTDFDRLILEVKTDGRVSPEEALALAAHIAICHLDVFTTDLSIEFDRGEFENNTDREALLAKLALKIDEIELSVRSTNCLAGANIRTIGELVLISEQEMLRFRNFGKKSLSEIKAKLEEMGLSLGMDLSKMGITQENVRQVIDDYMMEQAGKEL